MDTLLLNWDIIKVRKFLYLQFYIVFIVIYVILLPLPLLEGSTILLSIIPIVFMICDLDISMEFIHYYCIYYYFNLLFYYYYLDKYNIYIIVLGTLLGFCYFVIPSVYSLMSI